MENYDSNYPLNFEGLVLFDACSIERQRSFFEEFKHLQNPAKIDPAKTEDELQYTRELLFPLLSKEVWTIPEVITESEDYLEILNGRLVHFRRGLGRIDRETQEKANERISQLELLSNDTARVIKILKKKDLTKKFDENQTKRYSNLTEILKKSKRAVNEIARPWRENKYSDEKLVAAAVIISAQSDVLMLSADNHIRSLFDYLYRHPNNFFYHHVAIHSIKMERTIKYKPRPRFNFGELLPEQYKPQVLQSQNFSYNR